MALPQNPHRPGESVAMNAEAAITKYEVVKNGAAEGGVIKTAGANQVGWGVAYEAATAANQKVTVYFTGILWCIASAAIAVNAIVIATTDGKLVTCPAVAETDYYVMGWALTAAAGNGEYLSVLWNPHMWAPGT